MNSARRRVMDTRRSRRCINDTPIIIIIVITITCTYAYTRIHAYTLAGVRRAKGVREEDTYIRMDAGKRSRRQANRVRYSRRLTRTPLTSVIDDEFHGRCGYRQKSVRNAAELHLRNTTNSRISDYSKSSLFGTQMSCAFKQYCSIVVNTQYAGKNICLLLILFGIVFASERKILLKNYCHDYIVCINTSDGTK